VHTLIAAIHLETAQAAPVLRDILVMDSIAQVTLLCVRFFGLCGPQNIALLLEPPM